MGSRTRPVFLPKFIDNWLLSHQLIALEDDNSTAKVGLLRGDDRVFLVDDAVRRRFASDAWLTRTAAAVAEILGLP